METINLEYEKYGKCKKNNTYEDKLITFKDNIFIHFFNYKNELFNLLKKENVMVSNLPIFRYGEKVYMFGESPKTKTYEDGKYERLSIDEIKKYSDENFTIFIYTLSEVNDETNTLKFRTIILKEF